MNQYTVEETDLLLNTLMQEIDLESEGLRYAEVYKKTYIKILGHNTAISCDLLIKIVHKDPLLNPMSLGKSFLRLYSMIHSIPIELIPLCLNDIPEVAKWRLLMGK